MAESDARFDPRFDPAFQPPIAGDQPLVVDDPEPLFEHPVPGAKAVPDDAAPAPAPPTPARRGFNPWLALLWAIGLTLSVTGWRRPLRAAGHLRSNFFAPVVLNGTAAILDKEHKWLITGGDQHVHGRLAL